MSVNMSDLESDSIKLQVGRLVEGVGSQVAEKLGLQEIVFQSKAIWKAYANPMNTACELNENLAIRPSGLTVVNPFNVSFIKVPDLKSLDPSLGDISAGSGVNSVLQKNQSGNSFTSSTFSSLGYDEAFPPGTPNRGKVKKVIQDYLISYVKKLYKGKWPRYSYTPIKSMNNAPVYQCPVNKKTDSTGKAIVSGDSCMTSNCRYCWLQKDKPVTYGEH